MRLSDTMLGAILLMLGLAMGVYAYGFPAIPGQRYGAATFPILIAGGFVVCAIVLLVSGFRASPTPLVMRTEWTRKPGALTAVLITILCVIAYIVLARPVGFIPTSTAILLVMFRLLGVSWWKAIGFAIGATLLTDYIFRTLLLVPLPFGVMPRMPW